MGGLSDEPSFGGTIDVVGSVSINTDVGVVTKAPASAEEISRYYDSVGMIMGPGTMTSIGFSVTGTKTECSYSITACFSNGNPEKSGTVISGSGVSMGDGFTYASLAYSV